MMFSMISYLEKGYALSSSVEVNPRGTKRPLTREQVWKGLVLKSENAIPFIPGMERCTLLHRWNDGLLREVSFGNETYYERIIFFEPVGVRCERVGWPEDWIQDSISDSEKGLLLTTTRKIMFVPNTDSGKIRTRIEEIRGAYMGALRKTLETIRMYAQLGKI